MNSASFISWVVERCTCSDPVCRKEDILTRTSHMSAMLADVSTMPFLPLVACRDKGVLLFGPSSKRFYSVTVEIALLTPPHDLLFFGKMGGGL